MKSKIQLLVILSISLLITISCNQGNNTKSDDTNENKIEVTEVLQANSYTYVKSSKNGTDFWVTVPKTDIKVGEIYYYEGGMEMKNFRSKDLDRTFESVLFLEALSQTPIANISSMQKMPKPKAEKQTIKIEPIEGGITIAELFNNKNDYANKKVKIKANVVKVNNSIMGKNWIHLQDGTDYEGSFDLTITSQEQIEVGTTAIFEGIIALEKDFGAGYKYDVIMENSVILQEN